MNDYISKFVLDTGALCPILVLIAYDRGKHNNLIAKYFIEEGTYEKEMKKHLINKSNDILDKLAFKYPELYLDDFLKFFDELLEDNSFKILPLDGEISNFESKNNIIYHDLKRVYEENKALFNFPNGTEGNKNNVGEFRSYLLAILIDAEYFITFDCKCSSHILDRFKIRVGGRGNNKRTYYPWRVGIIDLCSYLGIMVDNDKLYYYIEFLKDYLELSKKYDRNNPVILRIDKLYKKYGELL